MKNSRNCWLLVALGVLLTTSSSTADNSYSAGGTDQEDNDGPILSPQKNEIILQKGQNFTLTCKGKIPLDIKKEETPQETSELFKKELRNLTSTDFSNPYKVALDLYNVDENAVGYYACFDGTIDSKAILNNLMEEPNNTDHVTYIYIYVNGTEALFAPLSEFFTLTSAKKAVLRCRPTMPDINITLSLVDEVNSLIEYDYEKYDPKIGMTLDTDDVKVMSEDNTYFILQCDASRRNSKVKDHKLVLLEKQFREVSKMPELKIDGGHKKFMAGENFTLNCSVEYQQNSAVALEWETPPKAKSVIVRDSNEFNITVGEKLYNAITVINATKDDAGTFTCILSSGHKRQKVENTTKYFLDKAYINLKSDVDKKIESDHKKFQLKVEVDAYPFPKIFFYRDSERLPLNSSKYKTKVTLAGDVILAINNLTVTDTANYTFEATNGYVTEKLTYDLRKKAKPTVEFGQNQDVILLLNTQKSLECTALGYPLPEIDWEFSNDENNAVSQAKGIDEKKSEYKVVSKLNVTAIQSGSITCYASNIKGNDSVTVKLLVYEISNGFGISDTSEWYAEDQELSIRCMASIYKFANLTWRGPHDEALEEYVKYTQSSFSHVAKLKIDEVSLMQAGTYTCIGQYFNGSEETVTTDVVIEAKRDPAFLEPTIDRDEEVTMFQEVEFSCVGEAVPVPVIVWHKDGEPLQNNTDGLIMYTERNHSVVNSTVYIARMKDENKGKYECVLIYDENNQQSKFVNLKMRNTKPYMTTILGVVIFVIIILILAVIYLTWKIRKEKKFRKELAAAGLLYFKEGVTKSLNPDLGIDEQAELLPYDEKFEFPPEKLILGKQLGAGAFGVVYKAEARGIINAEETTPVAVKMVKKTADNMFIKALASELKIMVHLGKHVNIVNLLGACTKNVGKRELIVIVEYCKFGNIHNYMQKHREVFIDQLTDNKEKNLGKVNRGYSCSSGSSGINSDYFGTTHTQATDHTFLNTANTNRSCRKDKQNKQEEFVKVSETGYVQPEWRSNYESDYSFDGRNPRPLTSRDLLAWAFQIARGMEYLANRKVLHGDLAARNVLLAEDNIVKICDFGLARSIYKNDEYQKKENSPLPVKWLAIECMTDRIFSTQSDIWSFGIVLWEMFSLAKTPYPNMSPQNLLQWLSEGHRLEKPTYADDRIYDVMMRCWAQKPNTRPSFTQLQELLGSFLEDNVRNHYVDLNSAYMDLNVKNAGQEDYLAMVSAPDYNNLVTPSPHHYVNDVRSFFPPTPTQVPLDEEGYLQMTPMNPSIFSPRTQSTKFEFDARKFDPKVAEGRGGSELTPMLTLNNLPARSGSDSDHEGHSPYLNMSPRTTEESDDVFKSNQINMKNIQNSAVTNPTYITLDVEKKVNDINNYINIPNGLVK